MNKNSILDYIVQNWKDRFTGTSALEIKDHFKKDHKVVMQLIRELSKEKYISINETQLGEPDKFTEIQGGINKILLPTSWRMVKTLMAFPDKEILEKKFKLDAIDYGEFTNRLHKGDSQIKHYFFHYDVLSKYRSHLEKYEIYEDSIDGSIITKTDYYLSLPETTRDQHTIGTISYGKYKQSNGEWGISVIAKDLDYLPKNEQHYWASYEIETVAFDSSDKTWEGYLKQNFFGDWDVPRENLIETLFSLLKSINTMINENIFIVSDNRNLSIPVINTIPEYQKAHTEIYKLIGPDNIDEYVLIKILKKIGVERHEFFNGSNEKNKKGKWALLKVLFLKFKIDVSALNTTHDIRRDTSHLIYSPSIPDTYYIEEFSNDLRKIIASFNKLKESLSTVIK